MGTKYMHFTTAGMGCSNSGPAWCRASDKVVRGVDCMKGVDDCLVQATSEEEMLPKLRDLLEAARKGNMKFSRKKIQIGGEVDFCRNPPPPQSESSSGRTSCCPSRPRR